MRSGRTNTLGKATAEIPRVMVPIEVKSILEDRAHSLGIPLAELHREILCIHALGVDAWKSYQNERIRALSTMGGVSGGDGS